MIESGDDGPGLVSIPEAAFRVRGAEALVVEVAFFRVEVGFLAVPLGLRDGVFLAIVEPVYQIPLQSPNKISQDTALKRLKPTAPNLAQDVLRRQTGQKAESSHPTHERSLRVPWERPR